MSSQQNYVNLSVKDFQIIQNANLSFLPGLNCIIGQSNNGKSALMRAAKACIYNEPGTTSVRLGCNNFAVGLQMNNHTVILQKGTNSIYKIDNDVYGKIGRTQLDEVAKALGIKQLNINGSNEEINFWDQMEKPFLLDRSETDLFRFIVDSGKDNNITTALKTITQDRQQISRDITITEGKIQAIEETIKRQEEELKNSEYQLNVCNKVIELGPKIKRIKEITSLKDKTILDGQQLSSTLETKFNLESILNKAYSKIENISTYTRKTNLISDLINKVTNIQESINNIQTKLNNMESLDIPDLNDKLSKYKLLSELVSKSRSKQETIQELSNKQFPSISDDFTKNAAKLSQLDILINNIFNKKEQISSLELDIKSIKKQIKELDKEIKEVGICPTCGQPLHNS